MTFSKFEQKQIALNKEIVARAKTEFLDATISCMLTLADEPNKDKDYVKWEKWKRRAEGCKKHLSHATKRLNQVVIKEKAFLDVCMESKHLEEMPKGK